MGVDPQAQAILNEAKEADAPALNELPLAEARAALDAIPEAYGVAPKDVAAIETVAIPGPAGEIDTRIVRPQGAGEGRLPILIYYHGGGWVLGHVESHLREARYYADGAKCLVVHQGYRLAPEARFPAAGDDCYAVLEWVHAHAFEIGGDANRIAIGGDSAGGNLAAVVAQQARDRGGPGLRLQMLVYPVTDTYQETESYRSRADGFFLTRELMAWFIDSYLNDPAERDDPRASPLRAKDFSNLPPALIATAGYDPLHDEGAAYAARLREGGVEVDYVDFESQIHGFVSMAGAIDSGRAFLDRAALALRGAFAR